MKRNPDGTFAKGNSGGPGRPKRSTEDKYLKKLRSRVTLKEWQKIVDTAVARAQSGDNVARAWLSDYLLGRPTQRIEGDVSVSTFPTVVFELRKRVEDQAAPGAASDTDK